MEKEFRSLNGGLELRTNGARGLTGYAARFDLPSDPIPPTGFVETIQAGAFAKSIADSESDVRMLFNHNPDNVLARQRNGTLKVSEDKHGLYFDATLPNTQFAKDLLELVRSYNVTGCSFQFSAIRDNWTEDYSRRELIEVRLFELGPVTFPAYPDSSIYARSQNNSAIRTRAGTYRFERRSSELYEPTPVDEELEDRRRAARAKLAELEL